MGGDQLAVFNTHLDALARGTDTLQKQIQMIKTRLQETDRASLPWILGGDFNLLPPDPAAFARLNASQKRFYDQPSEIAALMPSYPSVPSWQECSGPENQRWFTHHPNDRGQTQLDKTIDYIFFSDGIKIQAHCVRQHDTQKISDHLPILAEVKI